MSITSFSDSGRFIKLVSSGEDVYVPKSEQMIDAGSSAGVYFGGYQVINGDLSSSYSTHAAMVSALLGMKSIDYTPASQNYIMQAYRSASFTNALVPISNLGSFLTFGWSTSQLTIVSDSVNDAPGLLGISKIYLEGVGLDNGVWKLYSEEIDLNGTTPVTSVNSYFCVNVMKGIESGQAGGSTAAGNITAKIGVNTLALIQPSFAFSGHGFFMIPDNYTCVLCDMDITWSPDSLGNNTSTANCSYYTFENNKPLVNNIKGEIGELKVSFDFGDGFPVLGASMLYMSIINSASTAGTCDIAYGSMRFSLFRN